MKLTIPLLALSVLFSTPLLAQNSWQIELNSYGGQVLGDFSESDQINTTNGFSEYSFSNDLTVKYYIGDLGLGIRFSSGLYSLDYEEYEESLAEFFNAENNAYRNRPNFGYFSLSSMFGISYRVGIAEKWSLEPSFFFGGMSLVVPGDDMVFQRGATTERFISETSVTEGLVLAPGIRANWQFHKNFGASVMLEYQYTSLEEVEIEGVIYDVNGIAEFELEKQLSPQAFQLGIGFYYNFGS